MLRELSGWAAALLLFVAGCSGSHRTGDDGGADAASDSGGVDGGGLDGGGLDGGLDGGFDAMPDERGCPPRPLPPEEGCLGLCGNGTRDTCESCGPCPGGGAGDRPGVPVDPDGGSGLIPPPGDAGTCCTTISDVCDGADLGGATCESLGYAGGSLGCAGGCGFDMIACDFCERGATVPACTRLDVAEDSPASIAIASLGSEAVVAWVTPGLGGSGGVRLARVSRDGATFTVADQTDCLGATDARRVAIATTPDGFLLAVERSTGISLQRLDSALEPSGTARLIAGAYAPVLASRTDGGPLLSYVVGVDGFGALLDANGDPQWERRLFAGIVEGQYGSAVSTGDGFLVAQRASMGVTVVRVELDGTVGTATQPGGGSTEYPQLAWAGTEARLTWADFSSTGRLDWARLDRTGTRISAPVTLGSIPLYFNYSPMVTIGADSIVVFGTYTGGTGVGGHVEALRVSGAGVPGTAVQVNRDPRSVHDWRVALLDGLPVVVWAAGGYPGGLGIAVVSL